MSKKIKEQSIYKVEDIDQSGEDDALDSVRYGFMDLKWIDAKVGTFEGGKIDEEKTKITEDKELFDDDEPGLFKKII